MLHQSLAKGRWFSLSLAEQLGNVGSEFDRVIAAKRRNDEVRVRDALARFLELLDLTIADSRWAGGRRRELARLREECLEEIEKPTPEGAKSLSRYYLNFAIVSRAGR